MRVITDKKQLSDYLGKEIIDFLSLVYDAVRIVDPHNKKVEVIIDSGALIAQQDSSCYEAWDREEMCSNCTSMRAIAIQRAVSKLEIAGTDAYFVHSLPFKSRDGHSLVVEAIQNLTNFNIHSFPEENPADHNSIDPNFSLLLKSIEQINLQIYRDILTGAHNREFLMTKLGGHLLDSSIYPLSVLVFDLDNFKKINDSFGHIAGDAVLKGFVQTTQQVLRVGYDHLVRTGGDEFVLWMPRTGAEQAQTVITRIKRAIKEQPVLYKDNKFEYSFSVGSHTVSEPGSSLDQILQVADAAMYRDKERKH